MPEDVCIYLLIIDINGFKLRIYKLFYKLFLLLKQKPYKILEIL